MGVAICTVGIPGRIDCLVICLFIFKFRSLIITNSQVVRFKLIYKFNFLVFSLRRTAIANK